MLNGNLIGNVQGNQNGNLSGNVKGNQAFSILTYHTYTRNYIDRMLTNIPENMKRWIDQMFRGGIVPLITKLDILFLFAAQDQNTGLLNLLYPYTSYLTNATNVNSTTFTPFRGFTGDGISMHINTGYNPATMGANYTRNSASAFAYERTEIALNNDIIPDMSQAIPCSFF